MPCVLFLSPISIGLHNLGEAKGLCFAWNLNKAPKCPKIQGS